MSDFRKALIWTAVPIVVIGIISVLGGVLQRVGVPYSYDSYYLRFAWFGAAACWLLAVLVATGFAIAGRRQIASGMFAGIAIGILALGVTCFANMATVAW